MTVRSQLLRVPTYSPAELSSKGGTTIRCVVKNISSGGVKIEFAADGIPDEVHLVSEELGLSCDAALVWRKGPLAGLRFLEKQRVPISRRGEILRLHSPERISLNRLAMGGMAVRNASK